MELKTIFTKIRADAVQAGDVRLFADGNEYIVVSKCNHYIDSCLIKFLTGPIANQKRNWLASDAGRDKLIDKGY